MCTESRSMLHDVKNCILSLNPLSEAESPDRCVGLVGNYQIKVSFMQADCDDKGETSVLQNRMHLSQ